jgi:hypothetical protein
MFNEGVDLPNVDTVMMLRPTESSVIWTQQLGRGLRKAEGKDHLRVIDYIGNHRIFLQKIKALLEPLLGHIRSDVELSTALQLMKESDLDLPPGCAVTYDLVAIDIIRALLAKRKGLDLFGEAYRDLRARLGERPTASQMLREGFALRSARRSHGSWFQFVQSMGDLSSAQQELLGGCSDFFAELEKTPMTKSFKMLLVLAMLNRDLFPGEISLDSLREDVRAFAESSARLLEDVGDAVKSDRDLDSLLIKNPIKAWTEGKGTGGRRYFQFENGVFRAVLKVDPESREQFQEMVRELVEWRLAEYTNRTRFDSEAIPDFICKVSHAGGHPMLFLPDRKTSPDLPLGQVSVQANGEQLEASFVKVALNVVKRPGSDSNVLPDIIRGWFGEHAGLPRTYFHVGFRQEGDRLVMRPIGRSPAR